MSENTEKLARVSDSLERATDYLGAKLLAFPYSWVIVAVTGVLAGIGAFTVWNWL